jgi:hypothetical protein
MGIDGHKTRSQSKVLSMGEYLMVQRMVAGIALYVDKTMNSVRRKVCKAHGRACYTSSDCS